VATVRPCNVRYYTGIKLTTDVIVVGGMQAYDAHRFVLSPPVKDDGGFYKMKRAVANETDYRSTKQDDLITSKPEYSLPKSSKFPGILKCSPINKSTSFVVTASEESNPEGSKAQFGAACYEVTFTHFNKHWHITGRVFDKVDLHLPKLRFDTFATWCRVPNSARNQVSQEAREFRAGLHAAGHALLNVLPLFILCKMADAGVECFHKNENKYRPQRLLIYDCQPGGTGISKQVYQVFPDLLKAALNLIRACPCLGSSGCPGCVHFTSCAHYNEVLDKRAGVIVLEATLKALFPCLDV